MMKKLLLVIFSFSTLMAQEVSEGGINFEHGTWSQALQKAKKEKKLIMLDAYASWCGPCKWMAKNIFPNKEVGDYYNSNFVNMKMDMEKGEGINLSQKYGVMAYPTFYFIDESGKVIHQVCGGQEASEFIQSGKDALNPEVRISNLEAKYNSSPKNSDAAQAYFNAAEKGCIDVEAKVKSYMENLDPSSYLSETNFKLIEKFISDHNHITIKNLISNYDKYSNNFGKERVDLKFRDVFGNAILMACKKVDEAYLKTIQTEYRVQKNAPIAWLDDFSVMNWTDAKGDSSGFLNAATKFYDTYYSNDWQQLNSMAWTFYERTNNEKHLQKATEWVKKSISIQKEYANMDTYAALLYKTKNYSEAKSVAEEAIIIGKGVNENTKETEKLLEKINADLKK